MCAEKVCRFVSTRFFAFALNDTEYFGFFHIVMLSLSKHPADRRIFFATLDSSTTLRMTRKNLNFTAQIYQADNLAKLRQEFLSVRELIAKIFGAISRTTSLMRLSALLANKRCRCRDDGFCSDKEQGNTHPKQNPTYR